MPGDRGERGLRLFDQVRGPHRQRDRHARGQVAVGAGRDVLEQPVRLSHRGDRHAVLAEVVAGLGHHRQRLGPPGRHGLLAQGRQESLGDGDGGPVLTELLQADRLDVAQEA